MGKLKEIVFLGTLLLLNAGIIGGIANYLLTPDTEKILNSCKKTYPIKVRDDYSYINLARYLKEERYPMRFGGVPEEEIEDHLRNLNNNRILVPWEFMKFPICP